MKSFLRIVLITICALTAGAAKYHDARIEMSNGKILDGKLCLMGRRPVTIIPLGSKYQRKVLLPDIVSITQVTEQRSMNRPWAYKESGKVDKVYFDGSYPFYNFATDLLLTNGQSVRGHIISIPFRFKGKGPSKLFLTRQIKGKVGETFDDVVYPVKIVFTGRKGIALEPIKGTVAGYGKLLAVTALDNRREVVCFANIKGDSFEFTKLLPGTYDIFVLTDQYALSGMSGDGPENTANGEKLPPDALDGLRKVFPLADDFFKKRWLLEADGNTKFAKTLVYKRRADFYHAHKHTPGGFIWHLDVWSWHLAEKEWKIDRRYIMLRHKQRGGEKNRKLLQVPQLGAAKPGAVINIKKETSGNAAKFIRNLD
jgi:hypothetical protein